MTEIMVTGVSDKTIERITAQAARHHRSLDDEITAIVEAASLSETPGLEGGGFGARIARTGRPAGTATCGSAAIPIDARPGSDR